MPIAPVQPGTNLPGARAAAPQAQMASTQAAPPASPSPAVISEVKVPAGSGVFGTTPADIQTAVNGMNAQIANFERTDWSKLGATPDQIAKAKQYDMMRRWARRAPPSRSPASWA